MTHTFIGAPSQFADGCFYGPLEPTERVIIYYDNRVYCSLEQIRQVDLATVFRRNSSVICYQTLLLCEKDTTQGFQPLLTVSL